MEMSYPRAVRIMQEAAPARVFVALREELAKRDWHARLWVAEYRQSSLCSVDDADGRHEQVSVRDSWHGRVFAADRVEIRDDGERRVVGVPLTQRGHRIGVLEVLTPATVTDADVDKIVEVADALAHEIALSDGLTDHFERARRARALTVAAEMQWALLPATAHITEEYSVAGLLEPAYSVAGDAFDWAFEPDHLTLAVCDGVNRGVPAAMAMTLCMSALRNARRAAVTLADQASLADQALYAHYTGKNYIAALLMRLDVASGRMTVVDAGSPQLIRIRSGKSSLIELDAQLPLGMFEETRYREQVLDLLPGDRLIVVSDGVHAAPSHDPFGDAALSAALSASRLLSAQETVRHLVAAMHDHHRGAELDDDAVVVCLDWNGRAQ
jgi:serine phosphatase RsbU (regulator of sigma subunit)